MSENIKQTLESRYKASKEKLKVGDYQTASKMMNISVDNVKARFKRLKKDAIEAIEIIIKNRENMILDFSQEVSTKSEK